MSQHLTPVRPSEAITTEPTDDGHQTLLDRQRALEDHMLGEGAKRFRERLTLALSSRTRTGHKKAPQATTAGAGVKLLREAVEPMEQGICALLEEKGKRGPKHLAVRWLAKMDPATAAYITARSVIDGIHAITPLRVVASEIAATLLDELKYRRLQKARPALFRYKMERLPGSNYKHNKAVLDQTVRWALQNSREDDEELDVSDLVMTEQHRLLVGSKLIDIFATTTGLITVTSKLKTTALRDRSRPKRARLKQELYLEATPETKAWLNTRDQFLEFLTPVNLPMVMEPRPWGPKQRGGYHFGLRNKYEFVRGLSKVQRERTDEADMPLVYEAVNTIQNTAWQINRPVFQLVEEIVLQGRQVGNLSLSDLVHEPLPNKPHDIATNDEARKRYRQAARAVHERNHERTVRARGTTKTLLAANQVVDLGRIYFPCSLDFRGRIYPLTHYLNPQGDDLSKALLTFADAKPLGSDGARWLAIHGANCLDETPDGQKVKTMTLDERVQWIEQHSNRICQVATDPYADLWWTDADEPLQFYAFCIEWRNYVEQRAIGKGEQYECALPVSQDGSCNGLQHFSAMLRDPIGGTAVNLTPEDRPQDVYEEVAERVRLFVEAAAKGDDPDTAWLAKRWLQTGLVKRKLTKRPTMTFCYGSRQFGMAQQTLALLQEVKGDWQRIRALFTTSTGENRTNDAAQWMAQQIWFALQETVVAASEAMDWMQACARLIVGEAGRPVEWTVPVTRFPVRQEYYAQRFKQIHTVIAGKLYQPSAIITTDEVLVRRQVNAVAPNIVHSLDAAVLMLTVARAAKQGVTSFAMIHDSYGTVPADCGTLSTVLREAFVRFYRDNDVIGHFFETFTAQASATTEKPLPEPPKAGALDINDVMKSQYFFN